MKKRFHIAVFVSMVSLWACNNRPEIIIFPSLKKAALTEFGIADVVVWPDNLMIIGESIILYDPYTEWVFKIFSKEGFEYKDNLLRRGRGPDEEVNVTPFSRSYGEDAFLFQGTSSLKVAHIQYADNELNLVYRKELALPATMYNDYDFFLLNDKLCSANTYRRVTRDFRCSALGTDSVFEWGELTPLQRPKSLAPEQSFFIAKYPAVHPGGDLIAVVFQDLPILRIYDSQSGKVLHELHMADGSDNENFLESRIFDEGFITYYWNIRSTSDYIYALYRGTVMSSREDVASVVHVWKWDGTAVMSIELNRAIYSFDVTPDNKQIIASSIVDVDKLFVAEIPWD